jgi:hypothetical protein
MNVTFPVTITTAEELRLLEQNEKEKAQEYKVDTAVFDSSDVIRAHGMGVRLEADQSPSTQSPRRASL